MWYFTPKSDLAFLHELRDDVCKFGEVVTIIKKHEHDDMRYMSPDVRANYLGAVDDQPALRATLSRKHVKASRLAQRYGVNLVTTAVMYSFALQQAKMDIITALLEPTTQYFDDVAQRAIDSVNRIIGACEEQMKKELWHLCNPFYWVFALFKSILTSLGLGKVLKDNIVSGVSWFLVTVSGIAAPWIKQGINHWFESFTK